MLHKLYAHHSPTHRGPVYDVSDPGGFFDLSMIFLPVNYFCPFSLNEMFNLCYTCMICHFAVCFELIRWSKLFPYRRWFAYAKQTECHKSCPLVKMADHLSKHTTFPINYFSGLRVLQLKTSAITMPFTHNSGLALKYILPFICFGSKSK